MSRRAPDPDRGNGPPCPVPGHGRTFALPGGRYYCPHQSHDGRPTSHADGPAPASRSLYREEDLPHA
jgi:hypothetical protein